MNRNRSVSVGSVLVLTGWLGACAAPAAASPLLACLTPADARASAPPAWAPANGARRKEASR